MKIQANYNLLDITKMIMAFMVIGIHVKMNSVCAATVPTILEFIMGSAVSFFFITSGFLLQSKIIRKNNSRTVLKGTFIRILRLYIIWILLYLPISIIYYTTSTSPMTYQRLSSEFHGYTSMKAFQRKQVYVVNSMTVPYFEQVSFRPDWLLRDYIILLHPDLKLGNLKYFKPL